MADKTINDLTAATTLASGDLFEIENAGNNSRKITAGNAAAALRALSPEWWWAPPTAASFSTATADGAMTLTDDADVGLRVSSVTAGVTGDRYRYAYKALPGSGNWTVKIRVQNASQYLNNGIGIGLIMVENATSKVLANQVNTNAAGSGINLRRGTTTAFGADVANITNHEPQAFLRCDYDDTANTYSCYWSTDGKLYHLISAVAEATAFTTKADRVGIGIFTNGTGTVGTLGGNVDYWVQTGF